MPSAAVLPGLRAIVAAIDRQMSELPQATTSELRGSWIQLVKLLALEPEPQLRACPACNHVGMRGATRCGYCWIQLSPLPDLPVGEQGSLFRD